MKESVVEIHNNLRTFEGTFGKMPPEGFSPEKFLTESVDKLLEKSLIQFLIEPRKSFWLNP